MRVDFLYKNDANSRLLLVFNGWSVPVPSACVPIWLTGYDIAVVSEYDVFILPEVGEYREVVVLAWSLGVHAAELALQNTALPLTLTIAVNGTPFPIDDERGIPETIFKLTAERLTEQTLIKFRRRMGAADMTRGSRSIEELQRELLKFPSEFVPFRWDYAVISTDDRIFPPENQLLAWKGRADIIKLEGSHTPDFESIVKRFIINKDRVGSRFARGSSTYDGESDVQGRVAAHLLELWLKHTNNRNGGRVLEIGVGTGAFTSLYSAKIHSDELILWDLAPAADGVIAADGEVEIIRVEPESLRAVVSASVMQWFNSPAAFLRRAVKTLESGGLAVISTYGPQTFMELTECGVTPLPYLSEDSLRRIIPEDFDVLELHSGKIMKLFDTPMDALRHCRATGVNALPSAVSIREIERRWVRRSDGRVSLTFQPVYMILRKK